MDFPDEVRDLIPRWRRMGYEPHVVSIPGVDNECLVVFRTLTKREFDELTIVPLHTAQEASKFLGTLYSPQFEEIVETAVLWPKPLPDELPAASDKLIANAVIDASAWVSADKLNTGLAIARERATSLEGFLRSRIFAAYPTMTVGQVHELRFTEMMDLVAGSEVITGFPVDLRPWLDPEGYMKEQNKQEKMHRRVMKEREAGMNVDPRMKDPEFRRKLIGHAQESRERLNSRSSDQIDLQKMSEALARAKNA